MSARSRTGKTRQKSRHAAVTSPGRGARNRQTSDRPAPSPEAAHRSRRSVHRSEPQGSSGRTERPRPRPSETHNARYAPPQGEFFVSLGDQPRHGDERHKRQYGSGGMIAGVIEELDRGMPIRARTAVPMATNPVSPKRALLKRRRFSTSAEGGFRAKSGKTTASFKPLAKSQGTIASETPIL